MVKLTSLFAIALLLQITLYSQGYYYGYLVEFTDKNNTVYSVDNPEEYLSERAILRRTQNNIAITEQDFPVNQNYINQVIELNANFHHSSKWFNSAVFLTNSSIFIDQVMELEFVKNVSLIYEEVTFKKGNKVQKWNQVSEELDYGEADNQIKMCNAQIMHKHGFLGENIQIAVLDAGFWRVDDLSCFEELRNENRILGTWDFVEGNESVYEDHNHGMAVLSTMASNLPGELVGSAPKASYYLYRTENVFSEYLIEEENWIKAAEVADSAGVDIITASLGYSVFDNSEMNHSYSDMDGKTTRVTQGAEIAFSKGIFVVNSAGNEGDGEWNYLTAPSDGENVLCVGAVGKDSIIAGFSSRGPSADNRVKPDVVAQGLRTSLISSDGSVIKSSGTSFSCPLMAGMVACLWQALPKYSNKEILELMRKIGDRYQLPDNDYGYGIPNFGKVVRIVDVNDNELTNLQSNFSVFPIPFKNSITIKSLKNKDFSVALYSMQGKLLRTQKVISEVSFLFVDLFDLMAGSYILKIQNSENTYQQKIIKE